MSTRLALDLLDATRTLAAGSTVEVAIASPEDAAFVRRWADGSGNTVVAVHDAAIEILRGRLDDPMAALTPQRRPGHRLWVYTNFHCNLACDYCCVRSSPRAEPRVIAMAEFARLVAAAGRAGVQELCLTGGEPFMLLDLDERIRCATNVFPTTVLTNAMLWRGERHKKLTTLPREHLVLQVSLDSATAALHDRHRGAGSFATALDGIRLALDLGFRVRIAATVASHDRAAGDALAALFVELGLDPTQQLVRRIARQGAANDGLVVSRASLIPEICVTADGVWWHPVAADDPAMKVRDTWNPLDETIEIIRNEYREHRRRGEVLASTFPCA